MDHCGQRLVSVQPSPTESSTRIDTRRFGVSVNCKADADVPLLLLNGVGSDFGKWDGLRDHVGRTTLTFDVQPRHMGLRPSIRTFAKRVSGMLDDLGVEQVDLLGLSWGGMAAQQFAHDHPGRVRRLVLASTTPGFVSVPARPSSSLALMRPKRSAKRAEQLNKHLYAGDFLNDPTLIHQLGLLWPTDRRTYHRQMWAAMGWSSIGWLPRIRHRTLILHADDDPVIPYVNARLMEFLMPNSTLCRVRGGGHLFLYTRPEALGQQIGKFLSE